MSPRARSARRTAAISTRWASREAEIHQPLVGVATCWNEAAPCNIALNRQAQAVKLGVKQARGHPARVHHHHRHRRHRHGPRGHALLARLARRDRRHGRTDHARPLLRRARRARRLRQVAAGHDDGDGAAERAVGLHLRRLDPAGPACNGRRGLRGPTCRTCSRRSASTRPAHVGNAALDILERVACPSAGACGGQFTANTMACVSEAIGLALLEFLGRARPPTRAATSMATASGHRGDEPAREEHPRPRRRHPQEPGERRAGRRLHRRLDQRRAASAGHRA